jgi:decaprenylphospho-beta-D-erythro-pentofuranosid-2-ulose 2-reductase
MASLIGNKVVVFGATSAIATATLRLWTHKEICLVGRSKARLEQLAQDLKARGAQVVHIEEAEIGNPDVAEGLIERISTQFGEFDSVLLAHGDLPDQQESQNTYLATKHSLDVNFLSVVALLTPIANLMEKRKRGTIVVIGSVAGDRGRQSNYIYGTAKGAVSIFLQGLRNRLSRSNVNVVTIKPGFVDTPMTAKVKKGFLFATPEKVAEGLVRAVDRGKNEVYLPWFWGGIMSVIRNIPEGIFKRLKL